MLYVYTESDMTTGEHSLCLGTEELDDNAFVIEASTDLAYINARAEGLANTLREGGAEVKLH